MRTLVSVIVLTVVLPSLGLTQNAPLSSLERGAKIRISAATVPESEQIGRFDSAGSDSIHFRPDSRPILRSVPLANVRTIEVSSVTRTRRSDYATIGVIAGGIIGYISSNHNGQGLGTGKTGSSQNAMVGGIAGLAIGGGLGWWYGGKKKVESWQQVDR